MCISIQNVVFLPSILCLLGAYMQTKCKHFHFINHFKWYRSSLTKWIFQHFRSTEEPFATRSKGSHEWWRLKKENWPIHKVIYDLCITYSVCLIINQKKYNFFLFLLISNQLGVGPTGMMDDGTWKFEVSWTNFFFPYMLSSQTWLERKTHTMMSD